MIDGANVDTFLISAKKIFFNEFIPDVAIGLFHPSMNFNHERYLRDIDVRYFAADTNQHKNKYEIGHILICFIKILLSEINNE